jgi:TPR repeat protein
VLIGGFAGYMRGGLAGGLLGGVLGAASVYVLSGRIVAGAGAGARAVLLPSGKSTPYRHAFSLVDSHILRRRYAEAAALLEEHAMDAPQDPEAYIRLARLHRDHTQDYEQALAWYDHARATGNLSPGLARMLDDEAAATRKRLADRSPNPDA